MVERNDKPVSRATEKAVFHEAASACPFCGDTTLAALQIHHIDPRANGGTNDRSNLILTCASCHDKIEDNVITLSDVLKAKTGMQRSPSPGRKRTTHAPPLPANVVNFHGENSGVIANQLRMTAPRQPRLVAPAGVLASDADRRSYIRYLIERYHKFKKADVKVRMNYAILYAAIKREFGCTWEWVPLGRFGELAAFLHLRIDDTKLGRNQRARGHRRYSTYEEYLSGHRY